MIDIGVCECLCGAKVKHLDVGASGVSCTIVAGKRCACGRYRYLATFSIDRRRTDWMIGELQRCLDEIDE